MSRTVNEELLTESPCTAPEPETAEERTLSLGQKAVVTGGALGLLWGLVKLMLLVLGVRSIALDLAHGHWLLVLCFLIASVVLIGVIDAIRGEKPAEEAGQ